MSGTTQSKSKDKLLVLKDKVSKEYDSTANVVGGSILGTATGTLPVYDETGALLGYIALFDTADLA